MAALPERITYTYAAARLDHPGLSPNAIFGIIQSTCLRGMTTAVCVAGLPDDPPFRMVRILHQSVKSFMSDPVTVERAFVQWVLAGALRRRYGVPTEVAVRCMGYAFWVSVL